MTKGVEKWKEEWVEIGEAIGAEIWGLRGCKGGQKKGQGVLVSHSPEWWNGQSHQSPRRHQRKMKKSPAQAGNGWERGCRLGCARVFRGCDIERWKTYEG